MFVPVYLGVYYLRPVCFRVLQHLLQNSAGVTFQQALQQGICFWLCNCKAAITTKQQQCRYLIFEHAPKIHNKLSSAYFSIGVFTHQWLPNVSAKPPPRPYSLSPNSCNFAMPLAIALSNIASAFSTYIKMLPGNGV